MGKVIAVANQKGGVGKTITAHNLATALNIKGKKALMIDLDSQASLTISAGIEPYDTADYSIASVLANDESRKNIRECIHKTPDGLSYIVPSIIDLAKFEMLLLTRMSRETILAKALEPIRSEYDYIIIDCPPQLGILTLNALACADGVIVPVKTDYLAYRGLTHLNDTIFEVQETINPTVKIYGVIATMYKRRSRDDSEILSLIEKEYKVLTIIPEKVMAKRGVYDGVAVVGFSPNSDIAQGYSSVADMIISNKYVVGGMPSGK